MFNNKNFKVNKSYLWALGVPASWLKRAQRKAPLQLALIFESASPCFVYWDKALPSLGCLILPGSATKAAAQLVKADSLLGPTYLVDSSCQEPDSRAGVVSFQIYYCFRAQARLMLCFSPSPERGAVDAVFKSAS